MDAYGYGHETIFGCYYDEHVALQDIEEFIEAKKPRYVRGDFIVHKKEIN